MTQISLTDDALVRLCWKAATCLSTTDHCRAPLRSGMPDSCKGC